MAYEVIGYDEDDGDPKRRIARDGETLHVPIAFADAARREAIEDLHRRHPMTDGGEMTDAEVAAQAANEAWHAYRKRLGTPKARRSSLPPPPPSWQTTLGPLRRRKTVEPGGIAGDSASEFPITDEMAQACVDARQEYVDRLGAGMHRREPPITQAYADAAVEAAMDDPNFNPGRHAYEERSRRMSDAWKYKRERPARGTGPYLPASATTNVKPEWMSKGRMPAVGGSGGRSASMTRDAGQAAYERMCDTLSNRWRTHRQPAAPMPEGNQ